MTHKKQFNIEDRLVEFAVLILKLTEKLPKSYGAIHLSKQISRSGTAPALLYGEAQAAESRADFIHKMKIALKELRESYVCLKIIAKVGYLTNEEVKLIAIENNELISIFVKSISTAKENMNRNSKT